MAQLDTLEIKLDELLHKKAPVQLPPEGRVWIARNAWWLALIGGVSLLWSTLVLWRAGHAVDRLAQSIDYWAGQPYITHLGAGYYLSLLAMATTGVVMLVAATNLKEMRRVGWKYLFYAMLLQVLAAVFLLFTQYGGFGDFVGSLISATVGGYFLFQIRDYFTEKGASVSAVHHDAGGVTSEAHVSTHETAKPAAHAAHQSHDHADHSASDSTHHATKTKKVYAKDDASDTPTKKDE